jgi:hypothetical protein
MSGEEKKNKPERRGFSAHQSTGIAVFLFNGEGAESGAEVAGMNCLRRRMASSMAVAKVVTATAALLMLSAGSAVDGRQLNGAPQNIAVYVRDFELTVPTVNDISVRKPAPGTNGNKNPMSPAQEAEALQTQARNIKDFVANTLVDTLRKNGYNSSREQGKPAHGVLLEGIFAEPDGKNRIRRALLGGGAPGTKFILYVGTFDQKSLNQPLYKEAVVQEPDPHYGPVITMNAYVPLAKYEIDKDATEEDIQKMCGQIAANLTALLTRNPAAAAQSQ